MMHPNDYTIPIPVEALETKFVSSNSRSVVSRWDAADGGRGRIGDTPTPSESFRVLWIDDEPGLMIAHAKYIRDVGGCLVEFVEDGAAGLDAARRRTHDLIILDWQLPRLSGGELLAALRHDGCCTPIVILTGHGTEEIAFASGQFGAVAYLAKPIAPADLLEVIREQAPLPIREPFASPMCEFLAHAIVRATALRDDPRTFEIWGRVPNVTEDALHRACTLLMLDGRDVLTFARLLRAVVLVESQGVPFAEVLDVAAPKTLQRLIAKTGLPPDHAPSSVRVRTFLDTQTLIAHVGLLRRVARLINQVGAGSS